MTLEQSLDSPEGRIENSGSCVSGKEEDQSSIGEKEGYELLSNNLDEVRANWERSFEDLRNRIETLRQTIDDMIEAPNRPYSDNKNNDEGHKELYFTIQARKMCWKSNPGLSEMLSRFQSGEKYPDFGTDYLVGYLKEGTILPEEELKRYALRLDMRWEDFGYTFSRKFFDTDFNLCLTYDGNLIATVGFDAKSREMYIGQIQGIKGKKDKLKPLKWERALVDYATELAQTYSVPKVSVVSVDNNDWANKHGHLRKEQGKLLYDVTAKRCGFNKDSLTGNYVKILDPGRISLLDRVIGFLYDKIIR